MDLVNIKSKSGIFHMYDLFVDKFLKDANPSFVKVYVYISRHQNSSQGISLNIIAKDCNLLKSDVVSALNYWKDLGVITYDENCIELLDIRYISSENYISKSDVEPEIKTSNKLSISVASTYKTSEVAKSINSNSEHAHLFAIISQMLNKTLSSNDYKIIYSFIDYLKLPAQVIIMLFEYCVSISKTNLRYIEKIAYSWADNGITTPDRALKYVKEQNKNNDIIKYYKKKFKINSRELTDLEENYILSWINECKADEKTILNAYETTVLNTGRITFKYMDAIIRNEKDNNDLPTNVKNSKFRNYSDANNIGDIEKQIIEKMINHGGDK